MTIRELARALARDAAFTKDFVALAHSGRVVDAIALARRMAALKLGRIPGNAEMIELAEASIAVADQDIKMLEEIERGGT